MNRLTLVFTSIVLGLAAAGCEQGRDSPPKALVRVLHADPTLDEIAFLRVESAAANLTYRNGSTFSFDQDRYTFNVDVINAAGTARDRKLTFSEEVLAGTEYTFVLINVGGDQQVLVLEAPPLESASVDPRIVGVHVAGALPPVDIFLEPPGTNLSAAQPWGTLAFTERLAPSSVAPGDYRVSLTAPGDPAQVLLVSPTITLEAGESNLFAVVDMAGEGLATFGIARLRDTAQTLVDRNLGSAVRAISAAADRGARDVVIDDDFAEPWAAALPFGEISAYEALPRGERELKVTPEGNPGAIELDETITAVSGRMHTLLIAGEPGDLEHHFVLDDHRPIADRVKLRLFNGANQFERIDFFVVAPGTDISTVDPRSTLAAPVSSLLTLPAGEFELVLRENGTTNVLAGPMAITVSHGGVYGVLALDGAGGSAAEIVLFDDFE